MLDEPRHANCIAMTSATECFKLAKNDFLSMFGPLQALLEKQMRLRILRSVPLLASLSNGELSKVAKSMRVQMFNPGASIIKEGEQGSRFYIINDGAVRVFRTNADGKEVNLATLKENDYFGERALIKNEPRKASVSASSTVELLVLEQKWFQQFLLPSAKGSIQQEMAKREAMARMPSSRSNSMASDRGGSSSSSSSFSSTNSSPRIISTSPALAAKRAATIQPKAPKIPFEQLNILSIIGTGTFGRVKLVEHQATGRVMALKCMAKFQIVNSHQERNIMNEKAILGQCNHPFVLEQVATYQNTHELFILMEIIQGGELWSYIYEKINVLPRSGLGGFVEPVAQVSEERCRASFSNLASSTHRRNKGYKISLTCYVGRYCNPSLSPTLSSVLRRLCGQRVRVHSFPRRGVPRSEARESSHGCHRLHKGY